MKILEKLHPKPREVLHHLKVQEGEYAGLRLHLRLENDGSSVLVINASRVLFLNKTATEIVHSFTKGETQQQTVRNILKHYKVDAEAANKDYQETLYTINTFAKTPDVCPVSYLNVQKIEPFQKELAAPYRMDLALTYKCNNRCIHCYAGGPKQTAELNTQQWMAIIDKLHDVGIPHMVFTGGEPTLRSDLPVLIEHAQKRELVSGLVTNGRKLKDKTYLQSLIDAGLDHIQITVESHNSQIHDKITDAPGSWQETIQGLRNAIETPIYTISNTTLNQYNVEDIEQTIDFLYGLGLKQFACNSLIYSGKAPEVAKTFALNEDTLEPILTRITTKARHLGMEFTWYTPTQYCELNPLELELGLKTCSACRINMATEPDGTVIPCQSYNIAPLGNILTDDWQTIWQHPTCQKIRQRKYAPEKCHECPTLNTCGAGCPLKQTTETL
jgi:radical SAM protein with 4Fe4S-binding SPASM domain